MVKCSLVDRLIKEIEMARFIVVDITTGRQVGGIIAKSLHAAKCLSPKLFGWAQFNRVYEVK